MKRDKHIIYLYSEVMPYAIAVMRALVGDHGAKVDCVCWDKNKRTPFTPVNEPGITFHQRSSFDERTLTTFIEERSPAIMYVVGRMDELYLKMALKFKRTTKVVTGSDNQWTGAAKQRLAALLSPWLYRRYFEYIWVPGKRQHEFARRMGYPEKNIIPHLLTADTSVFGGVYERNREAKKRSYPHLMVYAGRFAKEKGVDVLMAAFATAKKETGNDWRLVMVGSGDMPVAKEDFIEIKPFMSGSELAAATTDWGAFCLPSVYEPWGVVIHEFAMAGMPIICSDKVGAADDMMNDGKSGLIFRSGDADALKNAIISIMNKTDAELLAMGDKGYQLSRIQSPCIAAMSLMNILT